MRTKAVLAAAALALVVGVAPAHVTPGQAGFSIANGNDFAGNLCGFGFTCTPDTIDASAGDLITMRITGAPLAPYVLLISTGASRCLTIPNVVNSLILDDPVVDIAIGTLDESSPILACPAGLETLTGPFPQLPPGLSFGLQVVTLGSGQVVAFTVAVVVNVV